MEYKHYHEVSGHQRESLKKPKDLETRAGDGVYTEGSAVGAQPKTSASQSDYNDFTSKTRELLQIVPPDLGTALDEVNDEY